MRVLTCWRGNKGKVVLDAVDIVREGDRVLHDGEGKGEGTASREEGRKRKGGDEAACARRLLRWERI